MKKIFILILFVLSLSISFGQSVTQRAPSSITVSDQREIVQRNLIIPRYTDTTSANLDLGIDSCGAVIFTYADSGKVYIRRCFPVKYWKDISGSGGSGGSGFTTASQGLLAASSTDVQLGATTIGGAAAIPFTSDRYIHTNINNGYKLIMYSDISGVLPAYPYTYTEFTYPTAIKLKGADGGVLSFVVFDSSASTTSSFPGLNWYTGYNQTFQAFSGVHWTSGDKHYDIVDVRGSLTYAAIQFNGLTSADFRATGETYLGLRGTHRVGVNLGAGFLSAMLDVNGTSRFRDSMTLFSRIGSTADSVYTRRSDGTLGAVAQSSIAGVNIYNSNGALTGNRAVDFDTLIMNWTDVADFHITGTYSYHNQTIIRAIGGNGEVWLGDYSGNVNSTYFRLADDFQRIELSNLNATGTFFKIANYTAATNGSVLTVADNTDGRVAWVAQSSIVGAVPTWPQTVTAGSTFSSDVNAGLGDNQFNINNANIIGLNANGEIDLITTYVPFTTEQRFSQTTLTSEIRSRITGGSPRVSYFNVYPDSIILKPYLSNLYIDSLQHTLTATAKMITWDSVTGRIETRAIPTGGSGITIGSTTVASGTNTYLLYNNAGVVGNLDPTSLGYIKTAGTSTLTSNITVAMSTNTFKFSGTAPAVTITTGGVDDEEANLYLNSNATNYLTLKADGANNQGFIEGATNADLYFRAQGTGDLFLVSSDLVRLNGTNGILLSQLSGTGTRVTTATSTGVMGSIANGSDGFVLTLVAGAPAWAAAGGGGITRGTTTITNGSTGQIPYDSAGVVGEHIVTGTGNAVVLSTTPTFTTNITAPLIIGGTGTTDDLILQTTSGVGASGADMIFKGGNNGATTFLTFNNSGQATFTQFATFNSSIVAGAFATTGVAINGNFFTSTSTLTSNATTAPFLLPGGVGTSSRIWVNGTTSSIQTAGYDYGQMVIGGGLFGEATSGVAPRGFSLAVLSPTISNGTATVDTLVGLYVQGPPTGVTAATGSWNTIFNRGDVILKYGSLQVPLGTLGVGTSAPVASAQLEMVSTTQGFLPPRMTTTEKNAISSPATGLIVYDTTLNKLCVWTGAAWETITSI